MEEVQVFSQDIPEILTPYSSKFGILDDLVVPKGSSSLDDPDKNAEPIEADHNMMCRFYGLEDPGYRQVSWGLSRFVHLISRKQLDPQNMRGMET